ncbi:HAD-IIIC family phosphatase [Paenibacillus sp. IHBB 10380]|uniref:HAD-IIIC family phosphatase n=1 Tax=Paenibacillus sp. IHBB 10380 TaxID=1566358 RepID=UPI0005CFA530|nr:HAD-IIIC family phosphatase [Paenibacillus sp. IHBB 10380]AJS57207.1 hypothetical protein UB51_00345 [Paenibacillus sp. IHBB 10380]
MDQNIEQLMLLSDVQKGLLFRTLSEETNVYTEMLCLKMAKHFDASRIRECWDIVLRKNKMLRSAIKCENLKQPVLIVFKTKELEIKEYDQVQSIEDLITKERAAGIDISKESFRVVLCKDLNNEHFMILISHHIFVDGWSTSLIVSDFYKSYYGKVINKEREYKDYLQYLKNKDTQMSEEFWDKQLYNYSGDMFLPYQSTDPSHKVIEKKLDVNTENKIKKFIYQNSITLSTLFYTAWSLFLSQYNKDNIDFGVASSGRLCGNQNFNDVIGLFMTVYPFHMNNHKKYSISEWIKRVKEVHITSLEHSEMPFAKIKEKQGGKLKEFNTLLVVENYPVVTEMEKDIQVYQVSEDTHYDLVIQVHVYDSLSIKYLTSGQNSLNLEHISNELVKIISKLVSSDINEKIENLFPSKYINVISYSPFEQAYLSDYIQEFGRTFHMNCQITYKDIHLLGTSIDEERGKVIKNLFIGLEYMVQQLHDVDMARRTLLQFADQLQSNIEKNPHEPIIINSMQGLYIYMLDPEIEALCSEFYDLIFTTVSRARNVKYIAANQAIEVTRTTELYDPVSFHEANIPYSRELYNALAAVCFRNIRALFGDVFKIIILDCDNTLWKGICAEDGWENVELSEDFAQFQRFLLQKKSEGFLLALCSKNNEETVLELFKNHPDMILTYSDFIVKKINWQSKAQNIKEICQSLDLSESNAIFVDDNITECASVINELPHVLTLMLPCGEGGIMNFMRNIWAFDKYQVTEEDRMRHTLYENKKDRDELWNTVTDEKKVIEKLSLNVSFSTLNSENVERVSQLSYRTNQFNMNGNRLDITDLFNSAKQEESFVIYASDCYGYYGIVGFVSVCEDNDRAVLTHFFLSCRALGRYIEHKILNVLLDYFKNKGINRLELFYKITDRNKYFGDFLQNTDWEILDKESDIHFSRPISNKMKTEFTDLISSDCIGGDVQPIFKNNNEQLQLRETHQGGDFSSQRIWISDIYLNAVKSSLTAQYLKPIILANELMTENGFKTTESVDASILQKLSNIWNDVLGNEVRGISEDFFNSGGSSLKAMALVSRINQELHVKMSIVEVMKYPVLKDMMVLVKQKAHTENMVISKTSLGKYAISPFAERIYTMHTLDGGMLFNIPFAFRIQGDFQVAQLENYMQEMVRNHRIFRTSYQLIDDIPTAVIAESINFQISIIQSDKSPDELCLNELLEPFDLNQAPLFRVKVVRTNLNNVNVVFAEFHHLIMDGQSFSMFIEELNAFYQEVPSPIHEVDIDYFDYAHWFEQFSEKGIESKRKEYWEVELNGSSGKLDLPYEIITNRYSKYAGDQIRFTISEMLFSQIRLAAMEHKVTPYTFMLAVYFLFLSKLTNSTDLNIGTPVSLRDNKQSLRVMGMMVNTIVIRGRMDINDTFGVFLQKLNNKVLSGVDHKECMYHSVLNTLRQNDEDMDTLFDTMFVFHDYNIPDLHIPECTVEYEPINQRFSQSSLIFEGICMEQTISCNFTYDSNRLNRESILKYKDMFLKVLVDILENQDKSLQQYQLISPHEMQRIRSFELTECCNRPFTPLHRLFEFQAEIRPLDTCLLYNETSFSYEKVNSMANALAMSILSRIEPQDVVMVICDKAPEVVVSMLAVMKSGGIYLPVLKDTPLKRIREIAETCKVRLIISNEPVWCGNIPVIEPSLDIGFIVGNPDVCINDDGAAYIIFTSGTTGKSKGVIVQHRSITNAVMSRAEEFQFNEFDIGILLMGYAFDGFMTSFFCPILSGSSLVLLDNIFDVDAIVDMILKHSVTHFIATPTMYQAMLENSKMLKADTLRTVSLAGEQIPTALVESSRQKLPMTEVANEYGPSENSVLSTLKRNIASDCITIGKPIKNCRVRIINNKGELCPIGVFGELCLSGAGLANGYVNDNLLTQDKFVQGINGDNFRWYKSGDLAKWLDNGEIVLGGRINEQTKVNGYRVDLLEIRNAILRMPLVKECCVLNIDDSFLKCYYTADRIISNYEFMECLGDYLPMYMIPRVYVRVAKIPINPNGKTDTSKLENYIIQKETIQLSDGILAGQLLSLFKRVLNNEEVTENDNFFAYGGTSLKATSLQRFIDQTLQIPISIVDIFTYPTVALLSEWITSKKNAGGQKAVSIEKSAANTGKLSFMQQRTKLLSESIIDNIRYLSDVTHLEFRFVFYAALMYAIHSSMLSRAQIFYIYNEESTDISLVEYDYDEDMELDEYFAFVSSSILKNRNKSDVNLNEWINGKSDRIVMTFDPVYLESGEVCTLLLYTKKIGITQRQLVVEYNSTVIDDNIAQSVLDSFTDFIETAWFEMYKSKPVMQEGI